MIRIFRHPVQFCLLFFTSLIASLVLYTFPIAHQVLSSETVEFSAEAQSQTQAPQGMRFYQAGRYDEAIAQWQKDLANTTEPKPQTAIYNNIASAYRRIGKLDRAIANWQKAIDLSNPNDSAKFLVEQAQAYSDLGQHQQAITLAKTARELAQNQSDLPTQLAASGSLGNAFWALGEYEQSLAAHQTALSLSKQLVSQNHPLGNIYLSKTLTNLGNLYTRRAEQYKYRANLAILENDASDLAEQEKLAQESMADAIDSYGASVKISESISNAATAKALLNYNYLLARLPQMNRNLLQTNRHRILKLLNSEPDSQDKAFQLINVASEILETPNISNSQQSLAAQTLTQALDIAQRIGDRRSASFALGSLGGIAESQKDYGRALEISRQAQFVAQQVNAADSLYRWQWQTGRILRDTGKTSEAIASYENAIATLQTIRSDIVSANKDLQFNFRDAVEPVYRELIALLLDRSESGASVSPQYIAKALDTLELLKLAELQNFFGDECVQVEAVKSTDDIDPQAAIIYSIILADRVEVILRMPDRSFTTYPVTITQSQLQANVNSLRSFLEKRSTDEYLPESQHLYNLLIKPLEPKLSESKIKTLVFIQDGGLRKIPAAALYDGKKFLIQKYAIANTPSLSLTTNTVKNQQNLETLAVGLTEARPPFAALNNVELETSNIQKIMGGTKLLDRDFTLSSLQNQIKNNNYGVIHIATHGKFGVDTANTFLLGYDAKINIEQIDNLLRLRKNKQSVELLTLSACQTAVGDDRATLGIAGVAVRAGVKSALASLWFINDAATVPLITEFYTQLKQPSISKAEALRTAQLKLIADDNYSHPAVWSSLILIGNWL